MNFNSAITFVNVHRDSNRPAYIEHGGRTLTYKQLHLQSNRFASGLEYMGLNREDRIAMLVLDSIEFPVAFWGAIKAGILPMPMNTLQSAESIKQILNYSRPDALIVSSELWDTIKDVINFVSPRLQRIVVIGDHVEGTVRFDYLLRHGSFNYNPVEVTNDDVAFWLFTSGTTGEPKGAMHTHGNIKATAVNYADKVLGIQQTDVVYSAAKMFFAYGLGNSMTFPLSVGATVVIYNGRPTPDTVTQILQEHNVSIFYGVPTLYAAMLANDCPALHGIRLSVSAGEALPADVGVRWQEITDAPVIDGIGSTEMLHIYISNTPDNIELGTSGIPVPGYEVKIVDDEGNTITEPDTIGELLVKGDSSAIGYWNNRNKSKSTFEGHWTRTGDQYIVNTNGKYVYQGRTDDMFKVSGIWLSPFEVEQALIEHANVVEAAVVPFRDPSGLEKPHAFVICKDTIDEDELKEFVKLRIGKWKYPRRITVVDELPKTATGKIRRYLLK